MRNLNYDTSNTLWKKAGEATEKFKIALKEEISYFAQYWKTERHESCILFFNDEDAKELPGVVCGTSGGMYLVETCNEEADLYFYLPKTTEAYDKFYESIIFLHENDDTLFYETIPNIVDIWFDGKNEIELFFGCNVEDIGKEGYKSAVKLAQEIVELIPADFEKITFTEEDDDGNTGYEKKHDNYYVGVKIGYNLK